MPDPGGDDAGPDVGEGWTGEGGGLRRWGIRALQLLLTVVVTWFVVDRVGVGVEDVAELDERWLRPAWSGVLGASGVLLAGFALSAALWGRMVRRLGGPRLGLRRSASIYFTSNLGRYVPGKVWQLAGLAYLSRREGVPAALAAAAAVLVQATSLAGATVVGAAALVGTPSALGGRGPWIAGGILAVVAVATFPPVFRRLLRLWFRISGGPPPVDLRIGAGFGARWVALFAGNWLVYTAAFWLLVRSFGMEGTYLQVGPAFAAAYVLGYVMVFAPAGLGVREGFLIAFLQPVTGGGAAAATAILARLWMTVVELLPALGFAGARTLGRPGEGGTTP